MTNKRRIILYVIVLSIISFIAFSASTSGDDSKSTLVGIDNVDVPVGGSDFGYLMVNDVSNLGSCLVTLSWDPSVVTVIDVNDSDFDFIEYYVDDVPACIFLNNDKTKHKSHSGPRSCLKEDVEWAVNYVGE